jgi:hypothetical protein
VACGHKLPKSFLKELFDEQFAVAAIGICDGTHERADPAPASFCPLQHCYHPGCWDWLVPILPAQNLNRSFDGRIALVQVVLKQSYYTAAAPIVAALIERVPDVNIHKSCTVPTLDPELPAQQIMTPLNFFEHHKVGKKFARVFPEVLMDLRALARDFPPWYPIKAAIAVVDVLDGTGVPQELQRLVLTYAHLPSKAGSGTAGAAAPAPQAAGPGVGAGGRTAAVLRRHRRPPDRPSPLPLRLAAEQRAVLRRHRRPSDRSSPLPSSLRRAVLDRPSPLPSRPLPALLSTRPARRRAANAQPPRVRAL